MNTLIEENDVTPVNLAIELERAVIRHRLDEDGSIYVHEDGWFPFWLHVLPGAGLLLLKTYTYFKRTTTTAQRLEVCNELNRGNYLIAAYVVKSRLQVDYALNYRDGLLRETLVRTCRTFAHNLGHGLAQVDPDNDLLLPPGQAEPAENSASE